ncbi:MAG: hypothetical protein WCQ95_13145 [Bacteroidota bacterium]
MEPIKAFYALSTWLLRMALLVLVYILFFVTLRSPDFTNLNFWIALGFASFAALLFIGGFMNKSGLTVISALFLMLGCVYELVMRFAFNKDIFITNFFVMGAIALFFLANGNRKK